jgi:predicted DNA-binding protein
MEIRLRPETEARLRDLETTSGRSAGELVEDAMAGYLAEAAQLRSTLDTRYDEIKTGRVKPIDGKQALSKLREKSKERRRSRS